MDMMQCVAQRSKRKYIDAEKIKQTFCAECNHTLKCEDCDIDYHFRYAPAADVQEVVRCKECKHREYDDFMKEYVCDLDAADPYERSRCAEDDEWFCKDGERKDG